MGLKAAPKPTFFIEENKLTVRYKYALNSYGKPVRTAEIYTKTEHPIQLEDIDPDALFVCRKLRAAGYETYVVGGAIRDLLIGKKPKDFDVVTSAHPRIIKKVLPRSRIIGKRFRLVHVVCPGNKIVEVATFRSDKTEDANVFGTLEEDVRRRDFSCNALYYDPKEETIIDHVDGVKDIKHRVLRNLIPLDRLFVEDPVRMIRAVKYAVLGDLKIGWGLGHKIRAQAQLLNTISPSRLTEEFYKILLSGKSSKLFDELYRYEVVKYFLPNLHQNYGKIKERFHASLKVLDQAVLDASPEQPLERNDAFCLMLEGILLAMGQKELATKEFFDLQIDWIKNFFRPIVPSNRECDLSLRALYKLWNVRAPKPRLILTKALQATTPASETSKNPKKRKRRRRKKTSVPSPDSS